MALVLMSTIKDTVGVITLNDPENLNAMSEWMAVQFSALVRSIPERHPKLRSIILTGAGRAFSAGGDLKMLDEKRALSGEENRKRMLTFYNSFLEIRRLGVPIIAAINGHAVGAGLCVASACDIRIAAEGSKLGFTFPRLGLHPGMGATYFLPSILGIARATELLLTGRVISAAEALQMGLVSKVVGAATIMDEAASIAAEIGECGPESIRQLLANLRGERLSLEASLEREALCQSLNYAGAEFAEGVRATMEKRKPEFSESARLERSNSEDFSSER